MRPGFPMQCQESLQEGKVQIDSPDPSRMDRIDGLAADDDKKDSILSNDFKQGLSQELN